jgi:hypothetical protein
VVQTKPPGATLTVDGKKLGAAPQTVQAKPGTTLEVAAQLDGYLATTRMIKVGADTREATVELSPQPPPASQRPGTLQVTSTPWAYVAVDGKILGQVTPVKLELPPGEHTVALENPEAGWSAQRTVKVEPGRTVTLDLRQ